MMGHMVAVEMYAFSEHELHIHFFSSGCALSKSKKCNSQEVLSESWSFGASFTVVSTDWGFGNGGNNGVI
ncbi:Intermediate Conductance Calcium-Activated Potassium Channel Protein 4 [Manis pentadactyla]|nr:Intermediate Conductance Calcium-Activated Potassium Channel Protein 4 [Manis pentadactyla]